MTEAPAAPAGIIAGTWHEAWQLIAAGALEQQRLAGGDMDADRITGKVPAACIAIDLYLDLAELAGRVRYEIAPAVWVIAYPSGWLPGPVFDAAVQLTVELYRRKDAAFGVLQGAYAAGGEAVRISRDQLIGVESLLAPFREGLGIG